jgi:calcium/calmodulin-dependent protein kinase kinase 2
VYNNYKVVKQLGKGSFGTVMMVEDIITQKPYAMKILDKRGFRKAHFGKTEEQLLREVWNSVQIPCFHTYCTHLPFRVDQVEVLKRLDHENVIKLLEVIDDRSAHTYNFVYELMELGAVMTEQEYNTPLAAEHCRVYFR